VNASFDWKAMKKYKEAPWWWYATLLVLAFSAGQYRNTLAVTYGADMRQGLIVVFKGQTTLPWWSYIVALLVGAFITVI